MDNKVKDFFTKTIKQHNLKYTSIIIAAAAISSLSLSSVKADASFKFFGIEPAASPAPAEPTTQPQVPLEGKIENSSITAHSNTDISISWDSVPDAEGYELTYQINNNPYTVETTTNTYTISGLQTATICTYQLRYFKTVLGVKTYSNISDIFSASTTVDKVTGLSLTDRGSDTAAVCSLSISWDKKNDASYKIYYKPESNSEYTLAGESSYNEYTIEGLVSSEKYDIYVQAYCLSEENTGEASDSISIYTCPAMTNNFGIDNEESHKIDLSWEKDSTADSFYLYRSVNDSEYELYKVLTETTFSDTDLNAGTVYSYMISSYAEKTNLSSPLSEPLRAVTTPYVTTGLALSDNTATSITLKWDYNETATGYVIYRRKGSSDFEYLTSTTETYYTDTELDSGKNYRYKIKTYADTEAHTSDFGDVQKTSTLPAQVILTPKAGYGKLRLKWAAVSGASGYYIYKKEGEELTLIDTIEDNKTTSIVYTDLICGQTYSYQVTAYRIAFETNFVGEASLINDVIIPMEEKSTTTTPSYYSTKKKLKNSDAWKKIPVVKKYANYDKSYTIPGIRSTNVDGFESTCMCPQGLTFAEDYLLISAYDSYGDENSVIYVIDKDTHELLTVIVLQEKIHAGGITYDGENVWITHGKKLCTIKFSDIEAAADEMLIYKKLDYSGMYNLDHKASFLCYYKNQIWTGNFEHTKNGKLYSYSVSNDGETLKFTQKSCITIPPAVQGVTFSGNKLILSRAYGYTNELNVYQPTNTGKSSMKIGKKIKTVKMPALNEEIDILGNFIYVNFESALPNSQALNHMDRVLAIKLKAIIQ